MALVSALVLIGALLSNRLLIMLKLHPCLLQLLGQFSVCGNRAGAFYRPQRAKGSTYQAAVRALAFKWIRILYRCWQTRTLYDETTYLNTLMKRGSPLLKNLDLG